MDCPQPPFEFTFILPHPPLEYSSQLPPQSQSHCIVFIIISIKYTFNRLLTFQLPKLISISSFQRYSGCPGHYPLKLQSFLPPSGQINLIGLWRSRIDYDSSYGPVFHRPKSCSVVNTSSSPIYNLIWCNFHDEICKSSEL